MFLGASALTEKANPLSPSPRQKTKTKLPLFRFHWNKELAGLDPGAGTASFRQRALQESDGEASRGEADAASSTAVEYDLLIGADGVRSAVRAALQAADPSLRVDQSVNTKTEYKSFVVGRGADFIPLQGKHHRLPTSSAQRTA